jgi:hypothetical protein
MAGDFMNYKKIILIPILGLALGAITCSSKKDVSGIYVHYQGDQIYYTLSINKAESDTYTIVFEGVPLDQVKIMPWTRSCTAKLQWRKIQCESLTLFFSPDYDTVTATYDSNKSQTFISDRKKSDEEITIYKNN